ncbi:hypothetical protein B4U79_18743 [Dinothrombium tinctorium]|uniref:RING-type domain-containing protein n=1 Tax=Dinothrombium tinctorium TaxID=1965070 RepID=A0A443QA17_9ACAR|nr:hypothetical protein B4U79_18743 [Dinothrombium tinctorium]
MGIDIDLFIDQSIDFDDFCCSICLDVLEEPLELMACDHCFCKGCLYNLVKDRRRRKCPLCRSPIILFRTDPITPERFEESLSDCRTKIIRNPLRMRRKLFNLDVRCPYKDNGCEEIIKVSNFTAHKLQCSRKPLQQEWNPPQTSRFNGPFLPHQTNLIPDISMRNNRNGRVIFYYSYPQ